MALFRRGERSRRGEDLAGKQRISVSAKLSFNMGLLSKALYNQCPSFTHSTNQQRLAEMQTTNQLRGRHWGFGLQCLPLQMMVLHAAQQGVLLQ